MGLLLRRLRKRQRRTDGGSGPLSKTRKRVRSRIGSPKIPTMAMNWAKSMSKATKTPLKQVLKSAAFKSYLKVLEK